MADTGRTRIESPDDHAGNCVSRSASLPQTEASASSVNSTSVRAVAGAIPPHSPAGVSPSGPPGPMVIDPEEDPVLLPLLYSTAPLRLTAVVMAGVIGWTLLGALVGRLWLGGPVGEGAAAAASDLVSAELAQRRSVDAKPASAAVPVTPPESLPARTGGFDRDAASAAIVEAAHQGASCIRTGVHAPATIQVTFLPSGRTSSADLVSKPYAHTPVGSCIERQVRQARVAPFRGTPMKVSVVIAP